MIPKYLLNTELKYANVNHMANLFLFVFLLFAFFYDNVIAIRCNSFALFEKRDFVMSWSKEYHVMLGMNFPKLF